MNRFLLDASALSKRYFPEIGSERMDDLFSLAHHDRFFVLIWGLAEVVAVLVRRRNSGQLLPADYTLQINTIRQDAVNAPKTKFLGVDHDLVLSSFQFIDRHSLNSTDAILLCAALEVAADLRSSGDDLVIVASDKRLLRAAQAEGIATFDPENQTQAELLQLIGP